MSDRDKLISLLDEAYSEYFRYCNQQLVCETCEYQNGKCVRNLVADYLIAHGVKLTEKENEKNES